jgi:cytochrome P450
MPNDDRKGQAHQIDRHALLGGKWAQRDAEPPNSHDYAKSLTQALAERNPRSRREDQRLATVKGFLGRFSPSEPRMSRAALPPGPKGHLLLGSLPELRRDQLGFYASSARRYGDVVPTRFAYRRAVLIFHPDLIEEVLVTRSRDFVKSPGVRLLRPLLGNGLLLSEGDFWLRQRRLVQPAFHRRRLTAYGEVMTSCTERHLTRWRVGASFDVHAEMMALTQAIVAKTLFDANVEDDSETIGDAQRVMMRDFVARLTTFRPPPWLPTPSNVRSRRAIRRLDAIVYRIIAARRSSGEDRGDLLSMLLAARDADDGRRMTDQQVRDEVMTLLLAGHETTAVALSWTWYLLAQHPHVDAALAEELSTVLGGRAPTVDDLSRLQYMEMVVTESLRLYPPAYAMGRQAVRATEVGGHAIARGVIVTIPTWVVHRDPRWFQDPETFRPERWTDGLARRLPRYAYFPFGGGPRQCVGASFAMMEAGLVLATIRQRVRLQLVPGQRVTPTCYVTLRPEPGIRMTPHP